MTDYPLTDYPLRWIDPASLLALGEHIEIIGRTVWLSATCRCRSAILRGVPGRRVSLLIDERLIEACAAGGSALTELTTGTKALVVGLRIEQRRGCFDGATRPNVIIRGYPVGVPGTPTDEAILSVYEDDGDIHLDVDDIGGEGRGWRGAWAPVHTGECEDPRTVLLWHWRQSWWSVPLPIGDADVERDVLALAGAPETWGPSGGGTVAAWNRAAERALYRLARERGWRKLTRRERDRLGFPSTQGAWVDDARYAEAQLALHERRGFGQRWPHSRPAPWDRADVGEYTLDAAGAGPQRRGGFGCDDESEWAA